MFKKSLTQKEIKRLLENDKDNMIIHYLLDNKFSLITKKVLDLVANKETINATDKNGMNPLIKFVCNPSFYDYETLFLPYLLTRETAEHTDSSETNALIYYIKTKTQVSNTLINRLSTPKTISQQDIHGNNALMYSLLKFEQLDCLISEDSICQQNNAGMTPVLIYLNFCATLGISINNLFLKKLVGNSEKVLKLTDKLGNTPFDYYIDKINAQKESISKTVLATLATESYIRTKNYRDLYPFESYLWRHTKPNFVIAEFLIREDLLSEKDDEGNNPLMKYIIEAGNKKYNNSLIYDAFILLANKNNITQQNKYKDNALILYIKHINRPTHFVDILINKDTIKQCNKAGMNPLMCYLYCATKENINNDFIKKLTNDETVCQQDMDGFNALVHYIRNPSSALDPEILTLFSTESSLLQKTNSGYLAKDYYKTREIKRSLIRRLSD